VATMGSELSLEAGVFFAGWSSIRGILPISAVAPAATAATPTPYFRNSLRETFLFELFSDSFCTLSSDVKLISGRFYYGTALNGFSRSCPILSRFYPETDVGYEKPVEELLFPSDAKEVREG
jgi:hypothetical protein